jgi:hypothetical protein
VTRHEGRDYLQRVSAETKSRKIAGTEIIK